MLNYSAQKGGTGVRANARTAARATTRATAQATARFAALPAKALPAKLVQRALSLALSVLLSFSLVSALPLSSAFADDTTSGDFIALEEEQGTSANPNAPPEATDDTGAGLVLAADNVITTEITTQAVPRNVVSGSADYLAGTINTLGESHIFDVVTYERLQKSVFNSPSKSIIVLGSPRNDTTQVTLTAINELAKNNGIEKIYFFDTHLAGEFGYDGVDITNPAALPAIYTLWTDLKKPNATYGAQFTYLDNSYRAEDTVLLIYDKSAGDSAASIPAQLVVKPADVETIQGDICPFEGEVATVFGVLGASKETTTANQYDFFATAFSTANPKVDAFYGADYYKNNPNEFKLRASSPGELLYLLNTPGTRNILVSGSWCPDSRLAIGWISENATRYDSAPVYVWDFRANGSSSAVTFLASDTDANPLPAAGWVGSEVIKALGPDYVPAFDNAVRSVRAGGDPSASIQPYGKTFRSPYLAQIAVNGTNSNTLAKEWIHTLSDYELPWHYNVGSSYKYNGTAADYYGATQGDKIDYELSSGYLTNAQKALGRTKVGDFFAGSSIKYNPSATVSASTSGSDNGCGDDNDPLDDLGGDRLIPNHGTTDYDVQHYDITISYDPDALATTSIAATTTVTAVANVDLPIVSLDFRALAVDNTKVSLIVGGTSASISNISRTNIDTEDLNKIDIKPAAPITAGQTFSVTIPYTTGVLDNFVNNAQSPQGFFQRVDSKGIAILGEPLGATYWFPNNDTPADGASYTITLKAPTAYTSVSNGVRSSNTNASSIRTTVWNLTQDTASYQIFAYISNDVTELAGTSNANYPLASQAVQQVSVSDGAGGSKVIPGLSYTNKTIYDSNSNRNRDKIDLFYNKLPYYIQELEKIAGAYPGESAGFVFENLGDGQGQAAAWGAVETRDRPFFTSTGVTSEGTFVHEYAHQWYGNAVRIAGWEDLWLNEGFATYVTDLFYENTQGFNAQAKWLNAYNKTAAGNAWWTYAAADIQKESDLFGGAAQAYRKGALALASLRSALGDEAFFTVLATWVPTHKGQAVTTADFISFAEQTAGVELDAWAEAWLYGHTKPASWPTLLVPGEGGNGGGGNGGEGGGEEADAATLSFTGATAAAVGGEAAYTVSLANAKGAGTLEITVAPTSNLSFLRAEALPTGWGVIKAEQSSTDGTVHVIAGAVGATSLDPESVITDATGVIRIVFTPTTEGSASVTLLQSAVLGVVSGFNADGTPITDLVDTLDVPTGADAQVVTTVDAAQPAWDAFDFNRDGKVDLADLTFAQYYYHVSASSNAALWHVVADRGIDVNGDDVVDIADYILIINHIYA